MLCLLMMNRKWPTATSWECLCAKIFTTTINNYHGEPTVCALFCYECAIRKIGSESHRGVAKIKQPWMLVQHLKTHSKEFTCQACTQVGLTGRSFSVKSELARHQRQKSCVQNHSDHTKLLRRRNKKTFHDSRRLRELVPDDDIEEDPEPGNPDIAEHRKFIDWLINSLKQWVSLFHTNNIQHKNIPHNKIFETDNFFHRTGRKQKSSGANQDSDRPLLFREKKFWFQKAELSGIGVWNTKN